jgi:hypothetical protein
MKKKAENLIKTGRMKPPGLRAIERARDRQTVKMGKP